MLFVGELRSVQVKGGRGALGSPSPLGSRALGNRDPASGRISCNLYTNGGFTQLGPGEGRPPFPGSQVCRARCSAGGREGPGSPVCPQAVALAALPSQRGSPLDPRTEGGREVS